MNGDVDAMNNVMKRRIEDARNEVEQAKQRLNLLMAVHDELHKATSPQPIAQTREVTEEELALLRTNSTRY